MAYLNAEFKKDVQWWIHFLPHFHTVSMIKTAPWSDIDKVIATDSCMKGGGGTFGKRYFAFKFPERFLQGISGISQLEATVVVIALKLWGPELQGMRFTIHCDNEATVYVVNSGRSSEEYLQKCAREIAFLACKFQFELKARHIAGVNNRLPDILSRCAIDDRFMAKFLNLTCHSWTRDYFDVDDLLGFSCPW